MTDIDVEIGFVYVDADAGGDANGTSWGHAFTDVNAGIQGAVSGIEVWVAEGPGLRNAGDGMGLLWDRGVGVAHAA